jgi:hypothetical protein
MCGDQGSANSSGQACAVSAERPAAVRSALTSARICPSYVALSVVEGGELGVAEGVGADVEVGRGVERDDGVVAAVAGVRVGVAVRRGERVVVDSVGVGVAVVVLVGAGSVDGVEARGADVVAGPRAVAATGARSGGAASGAVFRQAASVPTTSTTTPRPVANDPVRLDMADEPTPIRADHRVPDTIRSPVPSARHPAGRRTLYPSAPHELVLHEVFRSRPTAT